MVKYQNTANPMKENCRDSIVSESVVDYFAQFNGDVEQLKQDTLADCYQLIDDRYAVVYYKIENTDLVQTARSDYSAIPKLYGLLDTGSSEASGVGKIRRQGELGLFGQGCIIGLIDTGIDYTNPVFLNADGTTRIISIWDQTVNDGPLPDGFGYGTEFTEGLLNQALTSKNPLEIANTTDVDGHGTFLAGVAAGNIILNEDFTGYAPLAKIVMVKLKPAKKYLKKYFCVSEDLLCFQENDIAMAIRYLHLLSRRENRPLSICLGLGTNQESHEGRGIIEELLDSMSNRYGICAVTAAGNQGNAAAHYRGGVRKKGVVAKESGLIPGLAPSQGFEDMEIRVGEKEAGFTVSLWGTAPGLISAAVLSPSGEYSSRFPARVNFSTVVTFTFEKTIVYVDYEIVEQRSGDQLILFRFHAPTSGIWTIRVFYDSEYSQFDAWLPLRPFIGKDTGFLQPDPNITLCDPGNGVQTMTVAGYDDRTGGVFIESGRGYTRSNVIKPDFAAPCVQIKGPVPGGSFTLRSGTSISAAEAAGATALIFEYALIHGRRLYMNGIEMKKLLIKGATRDGSVYPNRETGWGLLNVYDALASLRETL